MRVCIIIILVASASFGYGQDSTDVETEDGSIRTYRHTSGRIMAKVVFSIGSPVGLVSIVYANGRPHAELEFSVHAPAHRQEPEPFRILNYWNESGKQTVKEGNGVVTMKLPILEAFVTPGVGKVLSGLKEGVWKGNLQNGGLYEETYHKGVLVEGTLQKDGTTYRYQKISEPPNPNKDEFYAHISNDIRYPQPGKKAEFQGDEKVFIEFTVGIDGSISNVKVAKSTYPDLDAEVVRLVSTSPPWIPAHHRGIPVKQLTIFPIKITAGQ